MNELIYEVTLRVDAPIAGEYDAWLAAHTEEMRQLPGFLSAEIFSSDAGATLPPGQVERVVHYRMKNRAALEAYFREHAPRMRAEGEKRFRGRFRASRRILEASGSPEDASE